MGAYFGCNGPNGSLQHPLGLPLVYRTPLVHSEVIAVMTNTAPIGPYRGAGREQASYIVERLVDKAAREMSIDRVSLRRRNLIPKSSIPYRSPSGKLYDSWGISKALWTKRWRSPIGTASQTQKSEQEARSIAWARHRQLPRMCRRLVA